MPHARRLFGDKGEQLAAAFLKQKGMRVREKNYTCSYGEIDLVAQQGGELVFVEVKTRKSTRFGYPEESITPQKIKHIMRTAEHYMHVHKWTDRPWRIDVVAITLHDQESPEIVHLAHIDNPGGF
jgi:putative endonuclease